MLEVQLHAKNYNFFYLQIRRAVIVQPNDHLVGRIVVDTTSISVTQRGLNE